MTTIESKFGNEILIQENDEGILIRFDSSTKELVISGWTNGWYDQDRSISEKRVSLKDFFKELGLCMEVCKKAIRDGELCEVIAELELNDFESRSEERKKQIIAWLKKEAEDLEKNPELYGQMYVSSMSEDPED